MDTMIWEPVKGAIISIVMIYNAVFRKKKPRAAYCCILSQEYFLIPLNQRIDVWKFDATDYRIIFLHFSFDNLWLCHAPNALANSSTLKGPKQVVSLFSSRIAAASDCHLWKARGCNPWIFPASICSLRSFGSKHCLFGRSSEAIHLNPSFVLVT